MDIITEAIITALAKSGAEALANLARKITLASGGKGELRSDPEALERHLTEVRNWSSEISFVELKQARPLDQSFVDLNFELGRLPTRENRSDSRKYRILDLLRASSNIVILGDPGAGKTTSLKRLATGFLSRSNENRQTEIPLLVRLRYLKGDESLAEKLLQALGVELVYDKELDRAGRNRFRLDTVVRLLSSMRARVLVDGLDELHPRTRTRITEELRRLLVLSLDYRILITCRSADFQRLEHTEAYTIKPLSDEQIELFAQKWLGIEKAKDLLTKIGNAPYKGSEVLPLTLAHLCAIYQRTGSVPEKPKTLYRKIVRLLLEDWDEQRSIERPSAYANFQVDRKEEFLRSMAFDLTLRHEQGSFDHFQLERSYRAICDSFALPKSDCRRVVREIESHTGLILEVAYEKFDFVHKTIQEYLTAEYLMHLPSLPSERVLSLPNEMALVVAMSSDCAQHFQTIAHFALQTRERDIRSFSLPFLRRVFLEKVDFRVNRLFGRSIVELFARTFYPSLRQVPQLDLPFEASSRIFRDVVTLEGARESLSAALREASREPNGGETWRLHWSADKVQQNAAPDEGIVVDSGFLRLAGLLPENGLSVP